MIIILSHQHIAINNAVVLVSLPFLLTLFDAVQSGYSMDVCPYAWAVMFRYVRVDIQYINTATMWRRESSCDIGFSVCVGWERSTIICQVLSGFLLLSHQHVAIHRAIIQVSLPFLLTLFHTVQSWAVMSRYMCITCVTPISSVIIIHESGFSCWPLVLCLCYIGRSLR